MLSGGEGRREWKRESYVCQERCTSPRDWCSSRIFFLPSPSTLLFPPSFILKFFCIAVTPDCFLFFFSLSLFFHIFLPPRLPLSLSVSLTLSLPGSLSVFLWLATKGWRSEPDVWMNSPNLLWRESRGRRSREEEAEEERYDWSGWRGGKRRALEKCWLLAEDK